jgi:MFS family permease
MAVAALSLGFWINRYGPWRVIMTGFVVFTLASVAIGLVENRYALDLLAIVYGAGLSCLFNPLMPFVMEYGRPEERQYISAVSFSLVSLSLMLGSLIGGFSPTVYGKLVSAIAPGSLEAYRAAILTGAFIGALGLVPLLKMTEPPGCSCFRGRGRVDEHRCRHGAALLQCVPQGRGGIRQ